jgi:hypothetical protein
MSKHRVAVLKVVSKQVSVTTAAAECGLSPGNCGASCIGTAMAGSMPSSSAPADRSPTLGGHHHDFGRTGSAFEQHHDGVPAADVVTLVIALAVQTPPPERIAASWAARLLAKPSLGGMNSLGLRCRVERSIGKRT